MLTQRVSNILFALLIIAASIWFAIEAQGFKAAGLLASSGLPSKFFPQLTLGFMVVCAIIAIFLYAIKKHDASDKESKVYKNATEARQGLAVLAVAVASYLIWSRFGFVTMAALMGPLCLIAMGIRAIKIYITVVLLTGFVYAVFTQLLNIRLV
jgi:hypothetical protein